MGNAELKAPLFGPVYATAYDGLYAEKNYPEECDLLESAFRRYLPALPVETVLDLGCGTGSHGLLLAERGYRVVGVDQSAEMIRIAESKAAERGLRVRWIAGDLRNIDVGERFDAVILMFSVLGYFTKDTDVIEAFSNARRHLRRGGLLCFDVWNGAAVENAGVVDKTKAIETEGRSLTRRTTARKVPKEPVCEIQFEVTDSSTGSTVRGRETHLVRYFFEPELKRMLADAGFALLSYTAFPSLDRVADASCWYSFGVARGEGDQDG